MNAELIALALEIGVPVAELIFSWINLKGKDLTDDQLDKISELRNKNVDEFRDLVNKLRD